MKKELFKVLASKMASQDNIATMVEVLSESEAFSSEEFDNIISMLAGAYKAPVLKESSSTFDGVNVNLTFKSFNKVKMRVCYTYQRVIKTLERDGKLYNKWEAERKGLAEEFKANALDRLSNEVLTDCCSYEQWAKYQRGNIVTID